MIDEKIKAEAEKRYPLLTKSDLAEILKIPVDEVYDRELRNANESPNEQRDAFIAGANFGKEMRWVKVSEGLPEKVDRGCSANVLVVCKLTAGNTIAVGYYNHLDERWIAIGYGAPTVTHWMPLPPEPGRGE